MDNLLTIRNLRVTFRKGAKVINAVDGLNLDMAYNETLVLAGESGSGKSITALAIAKILPASAEIASGVVMFEGADVFRLKEGALRRLRGHKIAYIFQEPSSYLNPVYTIGNQLAEAIILHQNKSKKEAYREAGGLLRQVKIKEEERVLFSYPHQLSGGMNQRVFIAMALACRPKLLIADEPTTSLDAAIEAEIIRLLLELKDELGFSLLFITHNLSIAKRIADKICIMHRGKIVEQGSREGIFGLPQHFHTKELIRAYARLMF